MRTFGLVELERASDRVEDAGRRAAERAAFELGVVLDAHAGQRGDLAAAQPGHTASPAAGRPACSGVIFARRETRNSRTSARLSTSPTVRRARAVGCPVSTPPTGTSYRRRAAFLAGVNTTPAIHLAAEAQHPWRSSRSSACSPSGTGPMPGVLRLRRRDSAVGHPAVASVSPRSPGPSATGRPSGSSSWSATRSRPRRSMTRPGARLRRDAPDHHGHGGPVRAGEDGPVAASSLLSLTPIGLGATRLAISRIGHPAARSRSSTTLWAGPCPHRVWFASAPCRPGWRPSPRQGTTSR